MHRATEESGLAESVDGSIVRRAEAVELGRDKAATSALTKCAFSWKFGIASAPTPYERTELRSALPPGIKRVACVEPKFLGACV
jgi:hypothetical protein